MRVSAYLCPPTRESLTHTRPSHVPDVVARHIHMQGFIAREALAYHPGSVDCRGMAVSSIPTRLWLAGVWGEASPQAPPEGAGGAREGDFSQTLACHLP